MKNSTFIAVSLGFLLVFFCGFIGLQIYVDPLFHYHAPSEGLEYPLFDDRYMNDGITRHFEYDSIITGSSMTSNFKTSQFDRLYGTKSIKVPAFGANYNEINTMLERAFSRNDHIRVVMRGLDLTMLVDNKDGLSYEDYPDYLYDDELVNDVYYILNKEIFIKFTDYVFDFMKQGGNTTSFDSYRNWSGLFSDGNKLRTEYQRKELGKWKPGLTIGEMEKLKSNVEKNVIGLVKEHPETQFYFFIPPYSILYWDDVTRMGDFDKTIQMQEELIDLLLPYENVHLYSYFLDISITCNLNNYIDSLHYNQAISEKIIENMADGTREINEDNKDFYIDTMRAFYSAFDYDAFFEGKQGF